MVVPRPVRWPHPCDGVMETHGRTAKSITKDAMTDTTTVRSGEAATVEDFDLSPGGLIERQLVHRRFGGTPGRNFGRSAATGEIFVFADPQRLGCPDGIRWEEGSLSVPADDPTARQLLRDGHLLDVTFRVFLGRVGTVLYGGTFALLRSRNLAPHAGGTAAHLVPVEALDEYHPAWIVPTNEILAIRSGSVGWAFVDIESTLHLSAACDALWGSDDLALFQRVALDGRTITPKTLCNTCVPDPALAGLAVLAGLEPLPSDDKRGQRLHLRLEPAEDRRPWGLILLVSGRSADGRWTPSQIRAGEGNPYLGGRARRTLGAHLANAAALLPSLPDFAASDRVDLTDRQVLDFLNAARHPHEPAIIFETPAIS